MLQALFSQLDIDDAVGLACFRAMRFREQAWVRLGQRAIRNALEDGAIPSAQAKRASSLLLRLAEFAAGRTRIGRAEVELIARSLGLPLPKNVTMLRRSGAEAAAAAALGAAAVPDGLKELHGLVECMLRLACNRDEALGYVMDRVLRTPVDPARRELLGALLSLFRQGLRLETALPVVDQALADKGILPAGTVRLIFGATNGYLRVAADGVEALYASGVLSGAEGVAYIPGTARLLLAIMRRNAFNPKSWKSNAAVLQKVVERFSAGESAPPADLCRMLLAIVCFETADFRRALEQSANVDQGLIEELTEFTDSSRELSAVYPDGPPVLMSAIRTYLEEAEREATSEALGAADAAVDAATPRALASGAGRDVATAATTLKHVAEAAPSSSGGDGSAAEKMPPAPTPPVEDPESPPPSPPQSRRGSVMPRGDMSFRKMRIPETTVKEKVQFVDTLCRIRLPIPFARALDSGHIDPMVQMLIDSFALPEEQVGILRAIFTAGTDPSMTDAILECVPTVLTLAAAAQEAQASSSAKLPTDMLVQAGELLSALLELLARLKQLNRPSGSSSHLPSEVRAALGTLAESFSVQPELILGFAALAACDLEGISDLASRVCEFDAGRMRTLLAAVDAARQKANQAGAHAGKAAVAATEMASLKTPQEIFIYFDADRSGVMELEEFEEVIKNMGLNMSRQRAMQIFAKADKDSNGVINMDEFEKAYEYLRAELTMQAMLELGLSTMAIVGALVGLMGFVGLIFVFIFFGISAFSGGSPFEGVVNSLMPLSSGAFAGNQSKVDPREKLEGAVKVVEDLLERLGESDN